MLSTAWLPGHVRVHALQREKSVVVETKGVEGAVDWTMGRV